jgi:hypothetical protein
MVLCCLTLGAFFGSPSWAQQDRKAEVQGPPSGVGRYHFVQVTAFAGGQADLLLDTSTGQIWEHVGGADAEWKAWKRPPAQK